MNWRVWNHALYIGFELPEEAAAGLRYFISIDLDGNGRAELQFAALRGQAGDMARFRPDWSSYGEQPFSALAGPRGGAVRAAEFSLPLGLLEGRNTLVLWPGVCDPAAGQMLLLDDGVDVSW